MPLVAKSSGSFSLRLLPPQRCVPLTRPHSFLPCVTDVARSFPLTHSISTRPHSPLPSCLLISLLAQNETASLLVKMQDRTELQLEVGGRRLVMEWLWQASNLHWRSLAVAYRTCVNRPKHAACYLLDEATATCVDADMSGIPLKEAPFPMILTAAAVLSHPLSIWEEIDGVAIHKYIMAGLLHNAVAIDAPDGRPDQRIVPLFSLVTLLGHIKNFIATHASDKTMTRKLLLARALKIFLDAQKLVFNHGELAWSVFEMVVTRWMHVTFAASSVLADLQGAPAKRLLFSETPVAKPLLSGLVVVQGQSPVVDNSETRLLTTVRERVCARACVHVSPS